MGGQLPGIGCPQDSGRGPHISRIRLPKRVGIPAPLQPLPQEVVGGRDNLQNQQGTTLTQPSTLEDDFDTISYFPVIDQAKSN